MENFGRYLSRLLYGLLWTVAVLIVTLAVLGCLILAGAL